MADQEAIYSTSCYTQRTAHARSTMAYQGDYVIKSPEHSPLLDMQYQQNKMKTLKLNYVTHLIQCSPCVTFAWINVKRNCSHQIMFISSKLIVTNAPMGKVSQCLCKLVVTDAPMGKVSQLASETHSFQLGRQRLELVVLTREHFHNSAQRPLASRGICGHHNNHVSNFQISSITTPLFPSPKTWNPLP